jgi:pyridinium-3,5-bisthiocarboxylic acid mononucleotide nickel chelatase
MSGGLRPGLHLHLDPCSGIAGDMAVAALVDAGVPEKVVVGAVKAIGLAGLRVGFERRKRGAFVGLGFTVQWPGMKRGRGAGHGHGAESETAAGHGSGHGPPAGTSGPTPHPLPPLAARAPSHGHDHDHDHDHGHEHRDYAEIRRLLRRAALPAKAKALAEKMFDRIARAEAALHGVKVEKVAFHEVGAWDSIADIVGVAAALAWLAPSGITASPPVLGSGAIHSAHGLLPVPAPATAAILRGLPVLAEGEGELTTPTGAAILAAVVDDFTAAPPMRLCAQGFGAGTREHGDRPNVLRVLLGETVGQALSSAADEVVLVAANIDDMNPQLAPALMDELFAAGALDVWFSPITMKKSRPALEVSALCPPAARADVERAFFAHSSTIGVRRQVMQRSVLARAIAKVATAYGEVRVKVASRGGEILGATPEFEDCRKLAQRTGVPVRQVLGAANAATLPLLRPPAERRR